MVLLSILNGTAIFDQLKIMTEFCAIKISKESIDYACTACGGCLRVAGGRGKEITFSRDN